MSPYEVIRNNIAFIIDAVSGSGQPTIISVSTHLLQQRLISQADHSAVITPSGLPPNQVVARLLTPIMNQIKYVPQKYKVFIEVLQQANLCFITEVLEEQSSSTCEYKHTPRSTVLYSVHITITQGPNTVLYILTHSSFFLRKKLFDYYYRTDCTFSIHCVYSSVLCMLIFFEKITPISCTFQWWLSLVDGS